MNILLKVSMAVICGFFAWRMYTVLRANPELLSKENMSKSFSTMGVLALCLIGGVALMVMLVRGK